MLITKRILSVLVGLKAMRTPGTCSNTESHPLFCDRFCEAQSGSELQASQLIFLLAGVTALCYHTQDPLPVLLNLV